MAQVARTLDPVAAPARSIPLPAAPQVIAVGDAPVEWSASPARALHAQLVQSFATPARRDDRLPLRLRVAVVAAAVLAPWLAIGLAMAALA